jgi:2-methylcitrate dehydratase PrpD
MVAALKSENSGALKGQLFAYFSAAVGAARLMKLSPTQMHSALGIALMQAAGTMQVVFDGDPPAKAIYGAFPNQAGVISGLLSRQGLGAEISVFEGQAGLFGMWYGSDIDCTPLVSNLGDEFLMLKVRFKPWPTSGVLHPFIGAALGLLSDKKLDIESIRHVLVRGGNHIRPFCEPAEERRRPQNAATAANSIFFVVAKILLNKRLSLADFTSDGLCQNGLSSLTDRMTCSVEPMLGRSAIIEVTTFSQDTYSNAANVVQAASGGLASYDHLLNKFYDCTQYAARTILRDRLDAVVETIEHLESVPDISILATLLNEDS